MRSLEGGGGSSASLHTKARRGLIAGRVSVDDVLDALSPPATPKKTASGGGDNGTEEGDGGRATPKRHARFVALANARKLALASRGIEVENVFVDQVSQRRRSKALWASALWAPGTSF